MIHWSITWLIQSSFNWSTDWLIGRLVFEKLNLTNICNYLQAEIRQENNGRVGHVIGPAEDGSDSLEIKGHRERSSGGFSHRRKDGIGDGGEHCRCQVYWQHFRHFRRCRRCSLAIYECDEIGTLESISPWNVAWHGGLRRIVWVNVAWKPFRSPGGVAWAVCVSEMLFAMSGKKSREILENKMTNSILMNYWLDEYLKSAWSTVII